MGGFEHQFHLARIGLFLLILFKAGCCFGERNLIAVIDHHCINLARIFYAREMHNPVPSQCCLKTSIARLDGVLEELFIFDYPVDITIDSFN